MSEAKAALGFWLVAFRSIAGLCPHCGQGRFFKSYLKQVDECPVCGEAFGHIRADDGPAWLTILIVGHVLAPILLVAVPETTWPDWLSMLVWPLLALVLALLVLPRAKALFIGIIWRTGAVGSEK